MAKESTGLNVLGCLLNLNDLRELIYRYGFSVKYLRYESVGRVVGCVYSNPGSYYHTSNTTDGPQRRFDSLNDAIMHTKLMTVDIQLTLETATQHPYR